VDDDDDDVARARVLLGEVDSCSLPPLSCELAIDCVVVEIGELMVDHTAPTHTAHPPNRLAALYVIESERERERAAKQQARSLLESINQWTTLIDWTRTNELIHPRTH